MFQVSVNCTTAAEASKVLAALHALAGDAPAKKRGRPAKTEVEAEVVEDDDAEVETPAPKKRGRPAKVEAEVEEETDEDDDAEEETEEDDGDDEPELVEGEKLAGLKKALTAYSKEKGSKDAAVKVLRKFAPSSEKVKVGDLKALLKALKV